MNDPGQQKLWSIPGDGVLARQGSLVLLTSIDDHEFAESLLEVLASTSQAGGDGRAFGDAISAQVEAHQSWGGLESGPTIVAFGPAREGIAFTVLGAAAVEFSTAHAAEQRLTADHPSMLLRSTVGVPVRSIRATLNRDESGGGTDRFTRLDSGTVRAGGFSYYSGPAGAPAGRPVPTPAPEPPAAEAPAAEPPAAEAPAAPEPFELPSRRPVLNEPFPGEPGPLPDEPRPIPGKLRPLPDEPAPAPAQSSYQRSEPDTMPPAPSVPRTPNVPPVPDSSAPRAPEPVPPVPPEPASTPPAPTKPTPFDPAKYGASQSPYGTEPGVVVNTGPSAAPPVPHTAVDMTAHLAPGPAGPGAAAAGTGGSDPGRHDAPAIVLGVYCKNGHFTDPNSRSCLTCGAAIKKRAAAQQPGPRPPLGVLVFDDGEALTLDGDYVLGRSPGRDQAVEAGSARPLRVVDDKGMVSRVHARIHLDGWRVLITDLGSANGTHVQPQGAPGAQRLEPHVPVPIHPGALFYVGSACIRYEQARD